MNSKEDLGDSGFEPSGLPDPMIARFLSALKADELGQIVGVNRNDPGLGLTVAWVWMPSEVLTQWEGEPVFNVQAGKYAFSEPEEDPSLSPEDQFPTAPS